MSKILLIHPSDELYGADKVLLQVLEALSMGNQLEVWLPMDVTYAEAKLSTRIRAAGIKVVFVDLPVLRSSYLNMWSLPRLLGRTLRTRKELRSGGFDVVYINTAALAPLTLLAKSMGYRTILHLHEDLGSPLKQMVIMPLVACADRIVAVSLAVQARLPRFVQRKSRAVYNGFPLERQVSPSSGSPTLFLLSSRWNSWKGHKEFLAAWEMAELSDARLIILGGPPEVGEAVDVRGIVSHMKTASSIDVVGETSDVRNYLNRCHVVVVPSVLADPLPTIAIEALAAGRPVMASNIGGLPEIVDHEQTGWLIDPHDTREWVDCLIGVNEGIDEEFSKRARHVFETRFDPDRFKGDVRSIVSGLSARGKKVYRARS